MVVDGNDKDKEASALLDLAVLLVVVVALAVLPFLLWLPDPTLHLVNSRPSIPWPQELAAAIAIATASGDPARRALGDGDDLELAETTLRLPDWELLLLVVLLSVLVRLLLMLLLL